VVVFDDVIGLSPEHAARWTALIQQCRPVLEGDGGYGVQNRPWAGEGRY
jgi:hypothetical protein